MDNERKNKRGGDWSMWAGVGVLFALLLGGWAILFTLANRNPVQTVPLAKQPAAENGPRTP
jgi:hypothetical protein